jgi:hypothetical protein
MPEISALERFKCKYCRMCGAEFGQGVSIFGEEGKRLRISEKIRKTLSVLVSQSYNRITLLSIVIVMLWCMYRKYSMYTYVRRCMVYVLSMP